MYDDLLTAKYKAHGRGNGEYDCYGLVIECAMRNGQVLRDIWYEKEHVPEEMREQYLRDGLNLKKIEKSKINCIVEMKYNGNLHMGYMIERDLIIHTTARGVRVTHVSACKIKNYYEVV